MTLLKAMRRNSSTKLVIAGEGPMRAEIETYIETHEMSQVSLAGYQEGDALKNLLGGAAFLVLPSEWYENYPMVILEAFASGKPVVASSIGGIPEMIDEGETGHLYEAGNEEALAACVEGILADKGTCEIMGRAARSKVEALCDGHYDRLTALYREAGARC
jgi:glycosyltransferase involved in cell wall biosynthesis